MEYVTVDDTEVPALGFGTSRMDTDEQRRQAVGAALDAGYRHIDTAQSYGSESAVGDALAESDLGREEVFLTTKLSSENRAHDAVLDSVGESLDRLGTDYVDLLLIHTSDQEVPHEETLDAMDRLIEEGVVRHIGVSNFSIEEVENAMAHADASILTNQVQYHVGSRQDDLLAFCIEEDVMLTAYSSLGGGSILDDETLAEIAERHDATPAQVAIRWLLDQPMVSALTMSSSPEHARRNFGALDIELSDDEMRDLFAVGGSLPDDLASKLDL